MTAPSGTGRGGEHAPGFKFLSIVGRSGHIFDLGIHPADLTQLTTGTISGVRPARPIARKKKMPKDVVRGCCLTALSILTGTFLVSCVSIPANSRYAEPATADPVSIVVNEGGVVSACQWGSSGGVCRAWLSAVEGKFPPYEANSVRVTPGEHAIKLGCNFSRSPLSMASSFTAYHGPFESSRSYYVRCVVEDGAPRVWLADSATGPALAEFIFDPPDPDEEAKIQKLPWYQRPVK